MLVDGTQRTLDTKKIGSIVKATPHARLVFAEHRTFAAYQVV